MDEQAEVLGVLNQAIDLGIQYGLEILGALIILIGGWIVAGWARRNLLRMLDRAPRIDETLKRVIANVVRYAILVFVLIAVLAQFGIQTASIIAVLGTAGMARSRSPDSADSQFFITFAPARFLDNKYTVWGRVVEGMENVDQIKKAPPGRQSGQVDDPDKILRLRVLADIEE